MEIVGEDDMADDVLECEICFDTVPVAAALSLCRQRHLFCADCCWRCCESSLRDGLVPACPKDKEEKCGAVSKRRAVAALAAFLSVTDDEARLSGWDAKLDAVYLSAERARAGAVQCIACPAWHVPPMPHSPEPQRIVCACGATFCSACRQPYHRRSSCAEALRLQAKWVRFLQDELPALLMAAVRVDGERWAPVLAAHAKAKGALDDATRDALSRFDELRKMELWKQAHCKRCPSCRRVVEKMDGCDMMICGNDAHGGNQQRGCGKPFVWSAGQPNSAIAYEADLRGVADYAAEESEQDSRDADREDGAMRERRLRRDAREEHQVRPGEPVRCDGCSEPIVGPRLQCVQCEGGVELCVACVAKDAGGSGRRLKLRDGRKHPAGHIFRRTRQQLGAMTYVDSAASGAGGSAAGAAPSSHLMPDEGLRELTARDVDMRPGLTTAAAAAARAAEVRAASARAAAEAASDEGGSANQPPVQQQQQRGGSSRKRPVAAQRSEVSKASRPSSHGGAAATSVAGGASGASSGGGGGSRGTGGGEKKIVIELLDSDED